MKKRVIYAVTGIRSEYDILYPVLKAIARRRTLELGLIVAGAHLSRKHGYTVKNIERDGFRIIKKISSLSPGDSDIDRLKSLSVELSKMSRVIAAHRPDFLLVVGDREEAMNTGIIGQYLNIPVAHISGGDRAIGNVDDQVRHAVTKLAHVHLPTNSESAERIRRLGEQRFRIFNVGNPGLDRILDTPCVTKASLMQFFGWDKREAVKPLLMVIQHSLSTEISAAYGQMKETMEAVIKTGMNAVVNYPNTDAGSRAIIRCIREYRQRPTVKIFKHIPKLQFVNALRHADCLLGNSSAGILEAPILKLPVINVGNRQKGRLHADNVQFVAHNRNKIVQAIQKAVFDKNYRKRVAKCSNPYGDGHTGERIADILSRIRVDERLLVKDITY